MRRKNNPFITTLVFAVLICGSVNAMSQDTNYARQILRQLTSESFHGRGYSFRGDSIAASFIRGELRRLGVKPLAEDYYQPYTFSAFSMEGPLKVSINGVKLTPYTQFRIPAWSKSTWGEYKVVQVPATTIMDAGELKKWLRKNNDMLNDIFVYIDASSFKSSDEGEHRRFDGQMRDLQRRNPFNSRGVIVGMENMSTYSPANTDYEHGYAYIEVLSSQMPKKVKKIDCSFFTRFHPNYPTQNVYGYVKGEVDTMIVYTAHYDHLGTMGDSVVFYGAHDNASGVAAVLDLARMAVADKPHYTQVFCFFSGEEAGLRGSKYGAEHPVFDFSKVRLLMNLDMLCGGSEGLMVFNAEGEGSKVFFERLKGLNNVLELVPELRPRENRPNSDHWWFSKHVPALFFLTMGQRYGGYHDPYDTCERCGLENYLSIMTLISSLAL